MSAPTSVGEGLRGWRQRRRLTQLSLATQAEISTRHLSFVETGRSRPTSEMILRLAGHLQILLTEQNRLLVAGGYAPRYAGSPRGHENLAPIMAGLRDLLDGHVPYPALLLDDGWDIIDANRSVEALLRDCSPDLLEPPVNALRITVHPAGLAPRITNLDEWAAHLLTRLSERANLTGNRRCHELHEELLTYLPKPHRTTVSPNPVLMLELDDPAGPLRFFSVSSTVESSDDLTLEGLHMETFVPADQLTRERLTKSASTPDLDAGLGQRHSEEG